MPVPDLIIRGRSVVLPDVTAPRSIVIEDGRIASIVGYDEDLRGGENIDVSDDFVIMPGLVDTHVHINSPGRSDWEGFQTATHAAAAGGVTTLIDMPLNSIPATTTLSSFNTKLETAANNCFVDVGFWGGVVPGNTSELACMFEAG